MNRRDFLRMSAAAGTLFCGPMRLALAQQAPYQGPFLLTIEANGAWDPTSFCDPKGRGNGPDGNINNYDPADIGVAGNISYAPPPDSFLPGGENFQEGLYSNKQFFDSHFEKLVVINGIDFGTNGHIAGRIASWTGTLSKTYPSIGALAASELAAGLPMPFVIATTGPGSTSLGITQAALIGGSNIRPIKEIAYPKRINVRNAATYLPGSADALISAASAGRRQRQIEQQRLLRINESISNFDSIRNLDSSAVAGFVENLNNRSVPNEYVQNNNTAKNLFDQAQLAFSAFAAGAGAAAHLKIDGFDTHGAHDPVHYPRLMNFLAGIDNIITDAEARGLADNLVILIGSDFGRTNKYNGVGGKDHWPHGSAMVWAGQNFFRGNRVVGATDSNQISLELDPLTLEPNPDGVRLTPEYLHQAIRDLLGIAQRQQVVTRFPFAEKVLPIFA